VEVMRIQETQQTAQFQLLQNVFDQCGIATEMLTVNNQQIVQEKGYLPDFDDVIPVTPSPLLAETQRIITSLNTFIRRTGTASASGLTIQPGQRLIESVKR
jgi:hypothetical protein